MTRIETIFGGLLAAGIFAVFAFVFFGAPEASSISGVSASPSSGTPTRTLSRSSLNGLLSDDPEDYVVPTTACECYFMGYDMVRERSVSIESSIFEGQVQTCYDSVGSMGAAALQKGAMDAFEEPRERRSCRPGDYL